MRDTTWSPCNGLKSVIIVSAKIVFKKQWSFLRTVFEVYDAAEENLANQSNKIED